MTYIVIFFLCVGVLVMLLTLNLLALIKVFDALVWVEAEISVIRGYNAPRSDSFGGADGCDNSTGEKA